jgi:CRP-like cAMP-binding protein
VDGSTNWLIAALPQADRQRLLAVCEPVELKLSQVLGEAGDRTRHVYFPTRSFISLVASVDAHPGLEVGMIGHEGMLGAHLSLGLTREPLLALVQGAGPALRVARRPFTEELARNAPLRQAVGHYLYVLMAQRATSAGCLRYHEICPRLARWLLMSRDRAGSATFHVTQEFMAFMLGVRRVGVTVAAGELQRQGLIRYHRGEMTIVDRVGLEAAACSCYRADKDIYRAVMQPESEGAADDHAGKVRGLTTRVHGVAARP